MIKVRINGQIVELPTFKGADGKSAYQYALEAGYKGTEQDFINHLVDASIVVNEHIVDSTAHNDIRVSLQNLVNKINTLLDADDETLNQTSEIVAYIKSNKDLIDNITTSKVNVTDIIDDLVTNISNKPLSAAQGTVLKTLVDELDLNKLDRTDLLGAIRTALEKAKETGEFDGDPGVGIASAVLNSDYTLTLNFTDGKSYTTPNSIRGEDGVGIASAVLNPDYTLTLNFSDGNKYTTPNSIRGEQGVSITAIDQTSTSSVDGGSNVIRITLSNGKESTFTVKNGTKGSTPIKGEDYYTEEDKAELISEISSDIISKQTSITNMEINEDGELIVNYNNGTEDNLGWVLNATGECKIDDYFTIYNIRFYEDIDTILQALGAARDLDMPESYFIYNISGSDIEHYYDQYNKRIIKNNGLYRVWINENNWSISAMEEYGISTPGYKEACLVVSTDDAIKPVIIPKPTTNNIYKINKVSTQAELDEYLTSVQDSSADIYVANCSANNLTINTTSVTSGSIVKLMYAVNGVYKTFENINKKVPSKDVNKTTMMYYNYNADGSITYDFITDGEAITVANVTESNENGGSNVIEFSDGSTVTVKNGSKGKSAYDYAKDSGFTGTEDEFAAKLGTPIVTPQMYGAAGDGVTDDTKAFEDALAANDNVFVPTGKYFITRPLNLTHKKSLVGSDNQGATLIYDGTDTDSIILIGRLSIFRNINITVKKSAFKGVVLDTNNTKIPSSSFGLNSRVEHITVKFNEDSPEARLIRIIVDSGTDANNMPLLTGICYQTFKDIIIDGASHAYGCGIEMALVQGRAFTEETKEGFPWITHISFDDISLGSPYRAIKAGVNNTSGSEYFNRISIGHILFNNVYTQYYGVDKTRYFFDVEHFEAYLTKCMAWDYHPLGLAGEKCNIIGEDVNLSLNDCEMVFGVDLLESCDFTAEVNSGFTVKDHPTYFTDKYFRGTFLRNGYDIVDAKIDSKLTDSYVANIAEEKINEILYSGYANVMDDPLTQIKVGYYYSDSNKDWKAQSGFVTIIFPIVKGGNIVRWASSKPYDIGMNNAVYLFGNDELTDGVYVDSVDKLLNSDNGDQYLTINNPNGLKYASIPFYEYDMPDETMIMTINREITGSGGESYTEHLRNSVINPAIENKFAAVKIPTKTSELENDSGFSAYITPEMYGAKGDGVTDDSNAIQAAIDAAGSSNIVYLAKKTYCINNSLVFSHRQSIFRCEGTISYTGTDSAIIIARSQIKLEIEMIDAPNGTAIQLNSGNHGLECGTHTISDCDITVNIINSSTIGLHEYTDTEPQTYNKFHINKITSSETCVFIECENKSTTTYIGECYYWLGKMTGANTAIKLINVGAHKFLSGAFEGLASDGTAMYLENTDGCITRNIRCAENYGSTIFKFVGYCIKNDFELGEIQLEKVDISELSDIGGYINVLRAPSIAATYGRCGTVVHINSRNGISYDITNANNARFDVNTTNFPDNIIKQVNNCIPNTLHFNNASTNETTFTMGEVYSGYGSLALGRPVAMKFHDKHGLVKLIDVNGATILDNTQGKYSGKTVSVKCAGYDYFYNNYIWDVQVMGDIFDSEEFVTKTELANNKYAVSSNAETWTFTYKDGSTVTKKVVLA